jgi:hypothetical protein
MAKLDRNYMTVFDILVYYTNQWLPRKLACILVDYSRLPEKSNFISALRIQGELMNLKDYLAPFQHVLNMKKDLVDLFKPNKGLYQVVNDSFQFFFGIANVLKGLFNLIASPVVFILNLLARIFSWMFNLNYRSHTNLFITISWLAESIFCILRESRK